MRAHPGALSWMTPSARSGSAPERLAELQLGNWPRVYAVCDPPKDIRLTYKACLLYTSDAADEMD